MQVLNHPLIKTFLNGAGFFTLGLHAWVHCESERPVGVDLYGEDFTHCVVSAGTRPHTLALLGKTKEKKELDLFLEEEDIAWEIDT